MTEVITLESYFMGRREQYPNEYTQQIEDNAKKLLVTINMFLEELGIHQASVSSGWRPPQINNTISNAAKKSYHQLGMAVDILDDKEQTLGKLIASRPDLLKKYGLWLEDLTATIGKNTCWVHLDVGTRSDRPSRTFKP